MEKERKKFRKCILRSADDLAFYAFKRRGCQPPRWLPVILNYWS